MSQTTKSFRRSKGHRFEGFAPSVPRNRMDGFLYFPPETRWALNSFRKQALTYIYRTALELAAGKLVSAEVSLVHSIDEVSSYLDLTLSVNADWNIAQRLANEISDKISEWAVAWSEQEREEYGRWIYFGIIPMEL